MTSIIRCERASGETPKRLMSKRKIDADLFRKAWSHFATGVTIVTTPEADGLEGAVHGMTANGVASVSLEPPLALAVIGHERNTHPLIVSNERFGISILAAGQEAVAHHFTMAWEERKLNPSPATLVLGQSRVIAGALAAMDCALVESYESGDHTIFVGRVEEIVIGDGEPLVYFRRGFWGLA